MSALVSLKFHTQAQHLTHPLASLPGSGRDTGDRVAHAFITPLCPFLVFSR